MKSSEELPSEPFGAFRKKTLNRCIVPAEGNQKKI
jgi:hypothetical protein